MEIYGKVHGDIPLGKTRYKMSLKEALLKLCVTPLCGFKLTTEAETQTVLYLVKTTPRKQCHKSDTDNIQLASVVTI